MAHRHVVWLLVLAGLFVSRVLAQLIQAVQPVSFLPPFQAWHGAVLPYPALLASQLFIMLILAIVLFRVQSDAISPSRWKYRVCFTLGGIYFVFMAFRLVSGLTLLADHPWFDLCAAFCAEWDQNSFDPDAPTHDLASFADDVRTVFARTAWDADVIAAGPAQLVS